ncbi:Protein CBG13805 [Caenorhabditis briggsae]|uniref:Uncharacterized protein n=2 Tax=Caenorhabditis briggsae TaxID=6238 RepID=A0AAE9A7U3_CAEBR|nr:Protein CBG13805 [Caenorhabditis briggsae]ULT93097.1 hypothetical protein L3Y34_002942 [Caenorhabditis briggsae]UMM26359.1 hypothetical protein L5515_010098 [Caenorhabditis briggsae]CAP32535.2 Protein CBG13805 [Caenorhabditis briggsae]
MFLILTLLILLIFLGVLVYFGTGFVAGKKKENGNKELPNSKNSNSLLLPKTTETKNTFFPCEALSKAPEDPEDSSISEDVSQNSKRSSEDLPEESISRKLLETEGLPNIESEHSLEQDFQLKIEDWKISKTPEGSPKSTSSCISSEISLDNLIEEEDIEDEQPSPMKFIGDPSIRLRPSSLPVGTFNSASTSSASIFNFSRKTPEFVPRMMLEEFEMLDRSVEKRKMDIQNLLKRIESAKRRHRRFSEEIQRVQIEHNIRY